MSSVFTAKATPSAEKLRGGYYTPEPLARFVANWVAEAGSNLLEPSCGDGAILQYLAAKGNATGVELIPAEAHAARSSTGAHVEEGDFFSWFRKAKHGKFDGVAGNPPYIRFGSWGEEYRELAFDLMRAEGLKPTRLTNAWLPFVVASMVAVGDGGRIGLVVPAELLQVGYAAELRAYLVDNCSEITVVAFSELVFPGILQEVLLLLAVKGEGPASIRTVEVQNGEYLDGVAIDGAAVRAPLHETEKWTKYFLSSGQISLLRRLRKDKRLAPLGDFARVNVGVVTGRNSFFCMTKDEADALQISKHTINLLSRSAQFTGIKFTSADIGMQSENGARTRLLALDPEHDITGDHYLHQYIKLGEAEEVHTGYKCSIRKSWWSVPSISQPDGFMLRQVSTHLRLLSNEADATSTDTVHRVFTKASVSMPKLAVAALNSVTLAMSEILGRSYGGGLLEIEPSEAISLPIPNPELVDDILVSETDDLLRQGRVEEAISLVDQRLMVAAAGFTVEEIAGVRDANDRLRGRRLQRGRRVQ